MPTDFEPIVAALWAHLKENVQGISYSSRRLKPWTECPNQPAMFLRHPNDEIAWASPQLSKAALSLEIWIYAKSANLPDVASDVVLSDLITSVLNAFTPDNAMTRTFTLGGLLGMAGWARVEGKIDRWPGDLDTQAIAVIPVKVLLP